MNRETKELENTLYTQTLMTYGVMGAVFIVLVLLKTSIPDKITILDIATIFMASFAPTTISFIGSFVFEYSLIKDNKRVATEFLVTIVFMSLLYIAYECINSFKGQEWCLFVILAFGIMTMIFAAFRLIFSVKGHIIKDGDIATDTSDGYIGARRRIK